jgi:hypothetical protein
LPILRKCSLGFVFCTVIFDEDQIIIMEILRNKTRYHGVVQNSMIGGCSKMFRCKARKKPNREAYFSYVERCGLQRNPDFIGTDERIVTPSAFSGKEDDYL